jgi:hypothetical protein
VNHLPLPSLRFLRNALSPLLSWMLFALPSGAYSQAKIRHRFLALDNGLGKLDYVDQTDSSKSWSVTTIPSRDLQIIGNRRVLECSSEGYREYDLADGALKKTVKAATVGTKYQSARRLPDGTTVLGGNNETESAIHIVVVDSTGKVLGNAALPTLDPNYPDLNALRLTAKGTYLFGNHDSVFEMDPKGKVLWRAGVPSMEGKKTAAYKILRLADGNTWVSAGSNTGIYEYGPGGGAPHLKLGGPLPGVNFFGDFQILAGGNTVVADWRGHGTNHGGDGISIHEFDKEGKTAWEWQDAVNTSSIQAVLILDGLDTRFLYDEREGVLTSAQATVGIPFPPAGQPRAFPHPARLIDPLGRIYGGDRIGSGSRGLSFRAFGPR